MRRVKRHLASFMGMLRRVVCFDKLIVISLLSFLSSSSFLALSIFYLFVHHPFFYFLFAFFSYHFPFYHKNSFLLLLFLSVINILMKVKLVRPVLSTEIEIYLFIDDFPMVTRSEYIFLLPPFSITFKGNHLLKSRKKY